ncbi:hypothetical protein [Spirosoma sp.]|uniref:hypothetical protein n=1 Tax=Spirosoma sp. TaxID=1899569 RepID=UPI002625DEAB|nr:hypothetical protein [Spirosoma sp.]MCX6215770.1 hypothetical protein [Spirosoma sp.]
MKNLCGALVPLMVVIRLNSCKVPKLEPTNYPSAQNFPAGKLSAVKTEISDRYDQVQRYVYQRNRLVTVNGYYVKKNGVKISPGDFRLFGKSGLQFIRKAD